MQFVRQSKFRHVFGKSMKQEFCLNDVRITKISWDSVFSAVNPKFIAIIVEGSGGPFMVIPLSKTGRVEKDYPKVDAHKAPCLEVVWNPFNDNMIASGSEDTSVKVWHIPDRGLTRTMTEPVAELLGHQRRVTSLVWHPSANNILLSAGADLKIFLWNVGTSEALIEIAGHPDLIWCCCFNYDGSKIVTTCKDKKIRIIDPRSGKILQQGMGHEGVKPSRAVYMKDGRILTTGFTKRSERMYSLRDEEALDEPIVEEELDTSNGVLFPLYDVDTGMLYLAGKGDSQIRYYEVNNDPPFVHFVNIFATQEPQRGLAFMPKRGLTIKDNEIARIYKCTNKGLVEVLQFLVPRKSELFQDDLYPETLSTTPAITADQWLQGVDADPILMSLNVEAPKAVKTVMGGAKSITPMSGMVKKSNLLEQVSAAQQAATEGASTSGPPKPTFSSTSVLTLPATPAPAASSTTPGSSKGTPTPPRENSPPSSSRAEKALIELRTAASKAPSRSPTNTPRELAARTDFPPPAPDSAKAPTMRTRDTFVTQQNDSTPSTPRASAPASRQSSMGDYGGLSVGTGGGGTGYSSAGGRSPNPPSGRSSMSDVNMEDMLSDIQKLKAVVRRHEKRIRYLEEQLADRDMVDLDGI